MADTAGRISMTTRPQLDAHSRCAELTNERSAVPNSKPSAATKQIEMLITVESETFVFRPSEVTAKIARKVRQATGLSIMRCQAMLVDENESDIDILSTVLYAAALQTSPDRADLDRIDDMLTYAAEVTVEYNELDPGGDDAGPE